MENKDFFVYPFTRDIRRPPTYYFTNSKAEEEWSNIISYDKKNGIPLFGKIVRSDSIKYALSVDNSSGWEIKTYNDSICLVSYAFGEENGYVFIIFKAYSVFSADDIYMRLESHVYNYFENSKSNKFSMFIKRSDLDLDKLMAENPEILQKIEDIIEDGAIYSDEITTIGNSYRHDSLLKAKAQRVIWAKLHKRKIDEGYITPENDLLPHYVLQGELLEKVVTTDQLPETIRYVAGVDVAFHDLELRMVAAIVVLDARTFEVVDQVLHETDITFPYIPRLFSYREAPLVMEAWEKLSIKPDLLVCNGHGLDHPMGIGLATHLGGALDVPSIGCALLRLVGEYDPAKLGMEKGSTQPLLYEEQVGAAVRTKDGARPLMVSMGHRVSVETAVDWVLRLCGDSRLPESTRQAERLVRTILPERTEVDFWAGAEPMSAVDPGPDWPDINKVLITREGGEE